MRLIGEFDEDGFLSPGMHVATWDEFRERFGTSPRRRFLMGGLRRALVALSSAGCKRVYLNGSFVTSKANPGDYDGAWDTIGVDPMELKSEFWMEEKDDVDIQKTKYSGELYPADMIEYRSELRFLDFFQRKKDTHETKGIVEICLGV